MPPITPQNLVRHELIGLEVKVKAHSGSEASGRVVDETRNTLTVEVDGTGKKFVKDQCVFTFRLPGPGKWVRVEGSVIVARSEDRIKKKQKAW